MTDDNVTWQQPESVARFEELLSRLDSIGSQLDTRPGEWALLWTSEYSTDIRRLQWRLEKKYEVRVEPPLGGARIVRGIPVQTPGVVTYKLFARRKD